MKVQDNKHDSEMKSEKDLAMDRLNTVQKEHIITLTKRDNDHNSTLRELERQKAQREHDHLDEVNRLTAKFEEEMRKIREWIEDMNKRHNSEKETW